MNHPKHPEKSPHAAKDASSFSAADFPALRSFLRGYFHQDMKDEYGSAEEAVREFCRDADVEERAAVAREWSKFLDQAKSHPLEQVNRILTAQLGSSYSLTAADLTQITTILHEAQKPTSGTH
jgi:hypothetical protein